MSRTKSIALLLLIATMSLSAFSQGTTAAETTVYTPPESLKQWYQPANERQVWLYTMFSLGRGMQAIGDYAAYEDKERLVKWVKKFAKEYRSIAKMVPEWEEELDLKALGELEAAAAKGEFSRIGPIQRDIGHSCGGCHKENRAVVTAVLRGPDFSDVVVEDEQTMEEVEFKDVMRDLGRAMNRIAIASTDGRLKAASSAYQQFSAGMGNLSSSCASCHETDRQRDYLLNKEVGDAISELGEQLKAGEAKQAGRAMGMIGGNVCGRCHSIHRTTSRLRDYLD